MLGIPHDASVIRRVHDRKSQTSKSREKRWESVKDAFVVTNKSTIEGKQILLVDDVITTGATMASCSQALLNAGCESVGIATIALAK